MKKTAVMFLTFISLSPIAMSHEGHVHEAALEAAPRGGILRDAGPFKAEAVLKGDVVRVYVYDETLAPLALDKKEAKGDVQFPRQKVKPVVFKKKDGFYEATISGIGKVHRFDLHLKLEIDGVEAVADFGIDNIQ